MQRRSSQRTSRRSIVLALALCGLFACSASAFARGNAGSGGGLGAGAGGAQAGGTGPSGGTGGKAPGSAPAPRPIKLQKLLERHHLTRSRVLDAEIARKGSLWVYELKLLGPDGVVRELRYNALNGDALPHHHD